MNFNLFTWVREGVKQSILLGVSDAIETIGEPVNAEEIRPRLLELLRQGPATVESKPETSGGRRRLGRSLKDLEPEGAAS